MDIDKLLTVREASEWVSRKFSRKITPTNISYLIQYGQVKGIKTNGVMKVSKTDLSEYFSSQSKKENEWKSVLGEDINWDLSFDQYKEYERTKHVHRLHPYKGKFIPQLVEYFLDEHTDEYKKNTYFNKGDIVLDPFCGSGTMLVQANELGINAIGVDISEFNTLISTVKVSKYDLINLNKEIRKITIALKEYVAQNRWGKFEEELLQELNKYNNKYFSSPEYRYRLRKGEIDQDNYAKEKELGFLPIFNRLVEKYKIRINQLGDDNFLDKWYLFPVRSEIDFVLNYVNQIKDENLKQVIRLILSRTVRSCRATTHADLATLVNKVTTTYYCRKHYKICKPLFSMLSWWERYSKDTIKRLKEFDDIRTETIQICLTGDSRNIDLLQQLELLQPGLAKLMKGKKIKGIFTSPPYVGLIDYHEQHAYAYEMFDFQRRDDLEIGPLFKGVGIEARKSYVQGISTVLKNSKRFLSDDFDVFIVANDKFNLYPQIAKQSGMKIINEFKRPVLYRTEKDKSAYSETVFHLKNCCD